ncbi:MAG: right-handed parallel beta-helix repeat-containing protein [Polyangiaceae bacterium]|nr:right-handed parallel beta-helix repeat-containing protein [Polyangiaceae bacterium]
MLGRTVAFPPHVGRPHRAKAVSIGAVCLLLLAGCGDSGGTQDDSAGGGSGGGGLGLGGEGAGTAEQGGSGGINGSGGSQGGDAPEGGGGGGGPEPGGKPGPDNTGVPPGTVLTQVPGMEITTPGAVIEDVEILDCVSVNAPNVTIRRSIIRCTGNYPVRIHEGASLLIEDSEIAASGGIATSGIAFGNYTARRLDVHGAADGFKADSNVVIEDCWIHDLWLGEGDHADGIQTTGGSNVIVRRNFIDIVDHGNGHGGNPNSCLQGGDENAPNGDWLFEDNWLYGGGWVVNFSGSAGNNQFSNNRFGRGEAEVPGQPDYPEYGPIVVYGDVDVSGNVWDDDGTPAE